MSVTLGTNVQSLGLRGRDVCMDLEGAPESVAPPRVDEDHKSWGVAAKSNVSGHDVALIVASWSVLAAFILYPALQLIALGATALVLMALDKRDDV